MEDSEYHDIVRNLVRIAAHQYDLNTDFRTWIANQDTINDRLTAAIERLDATQARIERLLERMIPPSPNGHD